jgi:mRNA interferase RelE/StbE
MCHCVDIGLGDSVPTSPAAIPPHLAHSEVRFAASPFPEGGESHSIVVDKAVIKDLQTLPPKQYKQVVAKILSLGLNPYQPDCKALKGIAGGYRADQGEFRILYYVQPETAEQPGQVQIFRVGKRNDDEVYQNL